MLVYCTRYEVLDIWDNSCVVYIRVHCYERSTLARIPLTTASSYKFYSLFPILIAHFICNDSTIVVLPMKGVDTAED